MASGNRSAQPKLLLHHTPGSGPGSTTFSPAELLPAPTPSRAAHLAPCALLCSELPVRPLYRATFQHALSSSSSPHGSRTPQARCGAPALAGDCSPVHSVPLLLPSTASVLLPLFLSSDRAPPFQLCPSPWQFPSRDPRRGASSSNARPESSAGHIVSLYVALSPTRPPAPPSQGPYSHAHSPLPTRPSRISSLRARSVLPVRAAANSPASHGRASSSVAPCCSPWPAPCCARPGRHRQVPSPSPLPTSPPELAVVVESEYPSSFLWS
jgi:hypothetical protein